MKNYLYVLLFPLFMTIGCKENKYPTNVDHEVKILDLDRFLHQDPITNSMKEVQVLPLYTDTNCLVGYIKQLEVHEPYIFIFDFNKNFFIYKMDGSFNGAISASGRGPKEVARINGFYVNMQKRYVAIYDDIKNKMFHYDFTGKLLEVVSCKTDLFAHACEMKLISDDKLLLALMYDPKVESSYATIHIKDYSLDRFHLNYSYRWKSRSMDAASPKHTYNKDGHYVVNILNDTIYHYIDGSFVPYYVLKSHLKPAGEIPPDLVSDYGDVIKFAQKRGMSTGIKNIMMTDSICYTSYSYEGAWHHLFWKVNTNKGVRNQAFGKYPNVIRDFSVLTTTRDYFVGFILAHEINQDVIRKDCSPTVVDALSKVKEDDNPVLVFYKINMD